MDNIKVVWLIWGTHFINQQKELYAVVGSKEEAIEAVTYLERGKDTSAETYSFQQMRFGLPNSHEATSISFYRQDDEELYYLINPTTLDWWRYYLTSAQAEVFALHNSDQRLIRAETFAEALAALTGGND